MAVTQRQACEWIPRIRRTAWDHYHINGIACRIDHEPGRDVTIEDDEIRIDTLESKLTIAREKRDGLIAQLHEMEHAERAGVSNQDRKRELVSLSEQAYQRVIELEQELEATYEMAGKSAKAS